MYKVRSAQMSAFEKDQYERFIDRITAHLREQFPDAAALPVDELRIGVAAQLKRADEYGLDLEQEQAIYATSAWLLGEDFDKRFPAAEAVLSSSRLTSFEKQQWLEEFTREIFARLEKS